MDKIDKINWMTDIYMNKNYDLRKIIFPGTHNSATYTINWNVDNECLNNSGFPKNPGLLTKYFVKPWVECNDKTIIQQLKLGIRCFDFRLICKDDEWYIHHTYTCVKLIEIINDIISFLEFCNNNGYCEYLTIVMTPYNYNDMNKTNLKNLLSKLNDYFLKLDEFNINILNKKKERLLIIWTKLEDDTPIEHCIRTNQYINSWGEIDDPQSKIFFLNQELEKHKNRNINVWQSISFTLTPQTNTVIKLAVKQFFIPCKSKGVEQLQKNLNPYLDGLLNDVNIDKANIIFTDYVEEEFVNKILNQNIKLLSKYNQS